MSGIEIVYSPPEAVQRMHDLAESMIQLNGGLTETLRQVLDKKADELGVHRLDMENMLKELSPVSATIINEKDGRQMNCPVCLLDLTQPIPPFCPKCAWGLRNDVTLNTFLSPILELEFNSYRKRVELARQNWNYLQLLKKEIEDRNELGATKISVNAEQPAKRITPAASGFDLVKQSEPDFDHEKFKEIAQDVFFRVQAAWMRRDTSSVQGLIGQQLKTEYDAQFVDLKQKGLINRLENIVVRSVEFVDVGMEGQEVYIKLLFTANLLDYTVEESSGKVVKGDSTEPVKFEEFWTFARPVDSTLWKLEGIQVK